MTHTAVDADDDIVYFDAAATSWPKAPGVADAVADAIRHTSSPSRSGHRLSIAASEILFETRMAVAELLGCPNPNRVAFTKNVTEALNTAIHGLVSANGRVLTTSVEHNSVMRPLRWLEQQGLQLDVAPCRPDGVLEWDSFMGLLEREPDLVVLTQASNVLGTIMPVARITTAAHDHDARVVLDAAQSAGSLPVSMHELGVDVLAFTGHKGLLGPTGTGGLCVAADVDFEPLLRGGTGSASELDTQPEFLPDSLESGTPNVVGLAGLLAGVRYVATTGVETIRSHELEIGQRLRGELSAIPGIELYGPARAEDAVGVLSVAVEGFTASDVGFALEQVFGVMTRVGLHCAPAAHRTAGTYPNGTIRLSWGPFIDVVDVERVLDGFAHLAARETP